MDLDTAIKLEKEDFDKRIQLRIQKGMDYATEDVLSNFKRVAKLLQILSVNVHTPEGVALCYIVLKLDRLCNILNRKQGQVKNEAITDTILDMQNYIDLLKEIIKEGEQNETN